MNPGRTSETQQVMGWSSHHDGGPFDPRDAAAYARWREAKLARAAGEREFVTLDDPARLSREELERLLDALDRDNFVLYRLADPAGSGIDEDWMRRLGEQLGLRRLDANLHASEEGVSSIQVKADSAAGDFIPYTDRPINWHTDGYYNAPERRVRAFILHCVRPAGEGGENRIVDHERVYIEMRDRRPDLLEALMREQAFSIPPLVVDGVERRGWSRGPVFSADPLTGTLHMRYSARLRHVAWAGDAATQAAAALLLELIQADVGVRRLTLAAGEGVISNNVLHARSAFRDAGRAAGEGRLLLRARYYDRIGLPSDPPLPAARKADANAGRRESKHALAE